MDFPQTKEEYKNKIAKIKREEKFIAPYAYGIGWIATNGNGSVPVKFEQINIQENEEEAAVLLFLLSKVYETPISEFFPANSSGLVWMGPGPREFYQLIHLLFKPCWNDIRNENVMALKKVIARERTGSGLAFMIFMGHHDFDTTTTISKEFYQQILLRIN